MTSRTSPDNTRTITGNSLWYVVDASAATLVMLLASVPVARVMGPEILGNYIYLVFLTTIAQRLANVGIPATACKYIAEFLGAGQPGIARDVFEITLRAQAVVATVVTAAGCGIAILWAEPQYKTVSIVIVLSMWPGMINNIPAQANVAAEDLRANIPASLANFVSYSALIVATLAFHWGLLGLASATLISRLLEAIVRYTGVARRMRGIPRIPAPPELRRRMFVFSRQNLALLALGLVVWDRSELLFLKAYCAVTQVAFYSLAFSMTNQLLMAPRAFSSASGYTIFAQYGRDRSRLDGLVQNATRYVWLLAVPLFSGLAAIAFPLIRTVYGQRYDAVVPVLTVMCIFSIPRAFQAHSESLLQATETQGFVVKWLTLCAVLNLALDWLLIPREGAIGAAVANGLAQTVAVGGVWLKGSSVLRARPPFRFIGNVSAAGAIMAAVVLAIVRLLPPALALPVGVVTGALVFGVTLRLMGCLNIADWARLAGVSRRLPPRVRGVADAVLRFLIVDAPPAGAKVIRT
jgi:O-antigen/teichoic acid export membrane protein